MKSVRYKDAHCALKIQSHVEWQALPPTIHCVSDGSLRTEHALSVCNKVLARKET